MFLGLDVWSRGAWIDIDEPLDPDNLRILLEGVDKLFKVAHPNMSRDWKEDLDYIYMHSYDLAQKIVDVASKLNEKKGRRLRSLFFCARRNVERIVAGRPRTVNRWLCIRVKVSGDRIDAVSLNEYDEELFPSWATYVFVGDSIKDAVDKALEEVTESENRS